MDEQVIAKCQCCGRPHEVKLHIASAVALMLGKVPDRYGYCDECHNLRYITRYWPQRGGWYIKGYGALAEMKRTVQYLRAVGFTLWGNRPVPVDAQLIYGPTGDYRAVDVKRKRFRVAKWIRQQQQGGGEGLTVSEERSTIEKTACSSSSPNEDGSDNRPVPPSSDDGLARMHEEFLDRLLTPYGRYVLDRYKTRKENR